MDRSPSSTTTSHPSQATQTPRKLQPTSLPIPTLSTPLAKTYTHVHPILLLSLSYLSFPSLVADPVQTLLSSLLPLSILQLSYVIICLPPSTKHTSRGRAQDNDKNGGGKKNSNGNGKGKGAGNGSPKPGQIRRRPTPKRDGNLGFSAKIIVRLPFILSPPALSKPLLGVAIAFIVTDIPPKPALLSLALSLLTATPLLFIAAVLFGAPLTTHFPHTLLLATHIALLAILPLFYVYGVDAQIWREISAAALPGDEVWGGVVGTLVGGWVGAVPIPLDWDREWQKWPVTIVTGAYIGWFLGRYVGGYLLRGKRIEFD